MEVKFNFKARQYEVYVTFFDGRPPMKVCAFYKESDARAYVMVHNVKC